MVDAKKIEKKLPNLIAKAWWSSEADLIDYRMFQFRKKAPDLYAQKRNNINVLS